MAWLSRAAGGVGVHVRPGVGAEVIDPGLAVIAAGLVPAKQEHLVPAEVGHSVAASCGRVGGGSLFVQLLALRS